MKNLLVPIDFSSISENAFKYACNLAKKLDINIDVMHVYDEDAEEAVSKSQVLHVNTATLDSIKVEKIQKYIEEFQARFPQDCVGVGINQHVSVGNVAEELRSFCETHPVRMIVMGTQGESKNKPMGSVTSEVIKNVSLPVLAIPTDAMFRRIERIVYCIDYEGYDKYTINSLTAFASTFDAGIIVLHINTEPQYFDSSRWANFQRMVNDAYDYENMRFEFLNHENIVDGIDEYISDKEVDMLAMLTRNDHLIDKVFPNSLTRKMVLHTEIPLLAFHE